MANIIGIDFGMQNLKVCYFNGAKTLKVDLEGNPKNSCKVSKNAVFYEDNEEGILKRYFFGSEKAEEASNYNNVDYIRYIKRELQKENYKRTVCSGKYTFSTMQIVTDIFKQIYLKMSESRYDMNAITILTVPVVFSEMQKETLKICAEQAGFHVREIITEPFAVLFSNEIYDECVDEAEEEDYVIIFDFGASTLDICFVKICNDSNLSIETLASAGLSFGGKDITDSISQFLREKYSNITEKAINAERLDKESAQATYFEMAEDMKNELYSEEDIPEVEKSFFGSKIALKRTNVDKLLDELEIWDKIHNAIKDMFDSTSDFEYEDKSVISKVILTGGTSRIQYFRDKIENVFENADMIGSVDDENSVYCLVSSGAVNYAKLEKVNVKNSIPMRFGVELGNGFEIALNRNSFFNSYGKRKYVTRDWLNKNKWTIKVYQTIENDKLVREHSSVDNKGVLYSGRILLNKALYSSNNEDIVVRMKFTQQGIVAETALSGEIKDVIEENIPLYSEVKYE